METSKKTNNELASNAKDSRQAETESINSSEILLLNICKICNPNGDPGDDNRPRMDEDRGINLATDVRLKAYIREFFTWKKKDVFVRYVNDQPVLPEERLNDIKQEVMKELKRKGGDDAKQ